MKLGIDYVGLSVTFFCHDGKGNYLLNKRSVNCRDEHGRWDPGGGRIEFGDTAEQTLVKEITEEYCTDILKHSFLGYRDVFREQEGKPTHWLTLDFRVHIDRTKVKNGEPHKFEELKWFRMDNLPTPLHSHFHIALEKYGDKLL